MNKSLNLIKVILVLILSMAIFPSDIRAQNMDILPEIQLDNDEALLYDAEIYAKGQGVSVEEALSRFHIQNVVGELDAKLSENEADTFAGLWIEHAPEFKVVVLFTQDGEERIEQYLMEELVDLVEVRSAEISLQELQNGQKENVSSLWEMGISVESEINVYENNIKIFVTEADKVQIDDAVQDELFVIPDYIKLITVSKLEGTEANIYGGLGLNPCTSAFAVQNAQGIRGISTAAHCSEAYTLDYDGIELPVYDLLRWGSYDVSWHTAPGLTVTNQFQTDVNGYLRRVAATQHRNYQAIGNYVCKYGVESGYTCGFISSKNYLGDVEFPAYFTFIRVNNTAGFSDLSSPGDSGGPWFNGTVAYGIHHGQAAEDPNDAVYMAINYVDGLGVSVVLDPVFADVPWDYWAWQDIERLYNAGFTGGCSTNPLNYCPTQTLTRAEMAVFLLRGIHGSSYAPPPVGNSTGFDDVPITHWSAPWVKQFGLEGITAGCSINPPLYCPNDLTTHAQMAIFLLRSKHGGGYTPPSVGATTGFVDVPTTHWAAAWIKQLGVEGITTGCGSGYYCPESNVTRAQMAGLLVRTFDLP